MVKLMERHIFVSCVLRCVFCDNLSGLDSRRKTKGASPLCDSNQRRVEATPLGTRRVFNTKLYVPEWL